MISGYAPVIAVNVEELQSALLEVQRRAVDGTVVPLFVDYVNQRVLIGSSAVSASPAKVEITSGDLKIITAGRGVILPAAGGSGNYYRVEVYEQTGEDGGTYGVLSVTKV